MAFVKMALNRELSEEYREELRAAGQRLCAGCLSIHFKEALFHPSWLVLRGAAVLLQVGHVPVVVPVMRGADVTLPSSAVITVPLSP